MLVWQIIIPLGLYHCHTLYDCWTESLQGRPESLGPQMIHCAVLQNEDEEARYSAVARGAKNQGDRGFDARNEDTFGSGASKDSSKAWSGAANSVAAITGR